MTALKTQPPADPPFDDLWRRPPTRISPPCTDHIAFFIDGVGNEPEVPVSILFNDVDMRGALLLDPARDTVSLRPIFRIKRPAAISPTATVTMNVRAAWSGNSDFVVFALVPGREEAMLRSFSTTMAPSVAFQMEPGWDEVVFYAFDDSLEARGICRREGLEGFEPGDPPR